MFHYLKFIPALFYFLTKDDNSLPLKDDELVAIRVAHDSKFCPEDFEEMYSLFVAPLVILIKKSQRTNKICLMTELPSRLAAGDWQ